MAGSTGGAFCQMSAGHMLHCNGMTLHPRPLAVSAAFSQRASTRRAMKTIRSALVAAGAVRAWCMIHSDTEFW